MARAFGQQLKRHLSDEAPGIHVHVPRRAGEYDPSLVAEVLGEEPFEDLPANGQATLWVDGAIRTAPTTWLRQNLNRTLDVQARHLRSLGRYAGWLRQRAHVAAGSPVLEDDEDLAAAHDGRLEARSDILMADDDDLVDYRQAVEQGTDVPGQPDATRFQRRRRWNTRLTAIKGFRDAAHRAFGISKPYATREVVVGNRFSVEATGLAFKTPTGSAGLPISPDFADALLQGALRIDADGHGHADLPDRPDVLDRTTRDHAVLQYLLSHGARRNTARGGTIHELPPPRDGDLNVTYVPDLIVKNDAGGAALGFERRLRHVRAYVHQNRPAYCELTRANFRPHDPILLTHVTQTRWKGTNQHGEPLHGRWAQTEMEERQRMVHPDGTSPMLWLSAVDGTPLGHGSIARIVKDAVAFTREHVEPRFPRDFSTHDCRHTFAVHMTCAIAAGLVHRHLGEPLRSAYASRNIPTAVDLVQASLGHANRSTTRLYVQHAGLFMADGSIDHDHFLG